MAGLPAGPGVSGPALGLALLLAAGPAAAERCRTGLVSDGVTTEYRVTHRFVVVGSESVFVDGEPVPRSGYLFDHDRGSVVLLQRPRAWTPVLVTYRCAGFSSLPTRFGRAVVEVSPTAESLRTVARVDTVGWAEARDLEVSGAKTVGVTVGSGAGVGIDQSTRIGLEGEVEGVAIEAELSDQSTPIPAEGTTRDIEELDRVVIKARGRDWQGSFGDVDLGIGAGGFGSIRRRAVGARVAGGLGLGRAADTAPGLALSGGYARPRGQYGRVEFQGSDGVQGPYILAPDGRSAEVVPGSEEVSLDGERLTRGWDQDYTIDYSTGEVVFTSRRVIGRLSRIEAEFQYVTEAYDRATIAGDAELRIGPGRVGVGVLRESDDPSRSLGEELSEEEREYLAGIGADTARAWLPGGTEVGAGAGDYVREGDHFRYAGRNAGDYSVRFTLVGDSVGSYRYDDSLLACRFVGAGLGNYVDSVRVSLPQRDDVGYGRAGAELGRASIAAEGALRRRSLNLFAGAAAPVEAGALGIDAAWTDSAFGVSFRHAEQSAGFRLPGQRSGRDFSYRWAGTTEEERRASDEGSLRFRPWRLLEVSGEVGRLVRTDGRVVGRYGGRAGLGWLSYAAEKVADRVSHRVGAAPAWRVLRGRAGWELQTRTADRHQTWLAGLEYRPAGASSAGLEYRTTAYSETLAGTAGWEPAGRTQLVQANGAVAVGEVLRGRLAGGYEVLQFPGSTLEDRAFGSGQASWTPRPGLRLQADVAQSNRRVQLRDEQFRYVGPGQGAYRRDSLTGRYVFDPDGDYERVLTATGRFAAARELVTNASAEVLTFRPAGLAVSFSRSAAAADSILLTEVLRYDVRVSVAAFEPLLTAYVGATGDASADRTLAVSGRQTVRYAEYLEAVFASPRGPEGRARVERLDTRRMYSADAVDYEECGWRAEALPVLGRRLRLEPVMRFEHSDIAEPVAYPELGRFGLTSYEAGLARSWSIAERMRLRLSGGAVLRRATTASLPFDVGLARPPGLTPSARAELEYVLSRVLTVSGRYRLSDRPDRPAEHTLSSELRAYF